MANEQTIDQLNIEINSKAKQGSSGMDKIIASIEKLRNVTGGGVDGLSGINASLNRLSNTMNGLKGKSGTVSSVVNSIQKLNDLKTDRVTGNLNTVIESLKSLGGMSPEIKELVNSLGALSKSGNSGVSGNALKTAAEAAKAQATIDKSALTSAKAQEGLKAIADKNKQIADSAQQAAAQEKEMMDSVDAAIGKYWNKQHASSMQSSVSTVGRSVARIPSATATSTASLQAAMNNAAGVTASGANRATGFVNRLKDAFKSAQSGAEGFGRSAQTAFRLQNFYGAYFIARKVSSTIGGFITNINSYIENMNLFSVAMGKSAQSGEQLAQSLQNVLGIDAGEAERYMGVFQQITTSFGTTNNQATIMSKNLTQLGYDIASYYNISTSTAFEKLQSGITGQTAALRQLGIDTSKARLQQELYNMGFKEKVNDLSQADKALLRYKAIMEQTTNAQGDMARTLSTPSNQLRIFQAQLQIAGRAIGSIFIPALNAILPSAIAVIEVIGEMASSFASLIGFTMPKIDYSSLGNGLSGVADDTADIGNNAKESKKELKGLISGFDELNVVDKNSGSDSGVAGANNGSVLSGIDLPQYDALAGAISSNIKNIKDQLEQYKPLIAEILKDALAIGAALLAWKISNAFFDGLTTLAPSLAQYKGGFLEISAALAVISALFTFAYTHSENFRLGIKTLGEMFGSVGDRISEFAKQMNIPALNGEQLTQLAASIVVLVGVIAIATGIAPIFGAIAVAGGLAVLAIQGVGYAASDSIEPVNLFGEGISEATKNKVQPFIKQMNDLDQTIKSIKWSGRIVTDSDVANVKSQVKQISDTIINELDSDKNDALKKLDPLKGMLDSQTYNDIVKSNQTHYDNMKKTVSDGEAQINQIMQTAQDQHRGLKQSEYDEISKIEESMKTTGIKYLSESQTESNLIFQSLKDNHSALSAQEASEIVKNSVKSRDETISNAKKQYSDIMTEAQRMFDVGAINKDQYDKISAAALQTKNDTIQQATEQHSKIVDEAKKQSGDLSAEIDWSTGDIKSKWAIFWEEHGNQFKSGGLAALSIFTQGLSDIALSVGENWPKIKQKFEEGWNSVESFFVEALPKWWNNSVAPWFTADKWKQIGKTAISSLVDGLKSIHIPAPHFSFGFESIDDFDNIAAKAAKALGYGGGVPTMSIDWYANGGAFSGASVIGVGEYAGASTNPEVVAPQSIIRETFEESNGNVVTALEKLIALAEKISEKDTTVNLDGKKISQNTNKYNSNQGYDLGLQST